MFSVVRVVRLEAEAGREVGRGSVEEVPGTAVHVALLARFREPSKDGFFAKGAVRYVDATDHVSLELMGNHPVALTNAIDALARRWADTERWTWSGHKASST